VLQFRHLRTYFHPDQPVYGLRHPQLGHKQIAFAGIADIAPQYVATLLAQQPHGPYHIGGYSFGCFVAFEVAQLLHRAGHQVGALIFLDLRRFGNPRQHIPLSSKIMARIKQDGLAKAWQRVLFKTSLLRRRFTSQVVPSLSVAESNILAKSLYVPKPYPGRVIFFQTQENHDVPYTWEPLIAGGIEVHEIPGNHDTMWHEPQVQILAEKLKTRLAQIH
jgi:thioesterase domain-containing protein